MFEIIFFYLKDEFFFNSFFIILSYQDLFGPTNSKEQNKIQFEQNLKALPKFY